MAGTRSRLGLIPEDRWRTPQLEVPTRSPPLEDSLFWLHFIVCGILVLCPVMGPLSPEVKVLSANYRTAKEFPKKVHMKC